MEKDTILIIGSGHLAHRVQHLLKTQGKKIVHIANDVFTLENSEDSTFEIIADALKDVNFESLSMTYLIDDRDERNLELLIALISLSKDLYITAALFNENIAPHLRAAHPNIQILNPAKIAAPTFIEALYLPIKHFLRYSPAQLPAEPRNRSSDQLITILIVSFAALIVTATVYFHLFENLDWLTALYFVIVTIATVGYGDISLSHSMAASKVADILLILGSTFFIWMIFSLTVDRIIKQRVQLALGRKKYAYKDHVILCGLGKLGYFVAEGLMEKGERLVIIEQNENSPSIEHFRSLGADVYIGNARLPRVLQDAGVRKAKAVFSVINNDYANLEVGLNARSFVPHLRLILRIFDESMSKKIKENLDIHLTFSMTAIADEKFVDILKAKN